MRGLLALIVGLSLWGASAKAEGIRYYRMYMACGETLMCQIMVEGMAADDELYRELRLLGKVTAIDYIVMLHKHAELMREYFPRAWAGRDCPMGDCDAFGGILPLETRKALR